MANITKKMSRAVNNIAVWDTATDQNDTPAAIAAGDVFRLEQSFGRAASKVVIVATAALTIRINSYYHVYPTRTFTEFFNANYGPNISQGVEHYDTTGSIISIPASSTYTLSGVGPIRNIEIVTKAGNFTLTAS